MTLRFTSWVYKYKVTLLCGVCLCLIASTVTVGSLALAQNGNTKCIATTLDPLRSSMNSSKGYYRLPRNITPRNYKLTLWPDMNQKTFSGSVAIQIEILEPTQTIQLHSNKLVIKSVSLRGNGVNVPIKSKAMTLDRRELLIVTLFEELTKGPYEFYVSFGGKLDNGIVGLYASSLKNKK